MERFNCLICVEADWLVHRMNENEMADRVVRVERLLGNIPAGLHPRVIEHQLHRKACMDWRDNWTWTACVTSKYGEYWNQLCDAFNAFDGLSKPMLDWRELEELHDNGAL